MLPLWRPRKAGLRGRAAPTIADDQVLIKVYAISAYPADQFTHASGRLGNHAHPCAAICTTQQMGDTHRHAARRVDQERVDDRRMVARDLRPRNKLGPRVEMHRSDGMNTSVWSRESVGNVISCSKRMVKNAPSLPARPSCRVSDTHWAASTEPTLSNPVVPFRTCQGIWPRSTMSSKICLSLSVSMARKNPSCRKPINWPASMRR